jgi:diacylglycerol kinase
LEIIKSFKYALRGVVYILKSERNARVHLLMATLATMLGLAFQISNSEMAAVGFAIIIVFVAEITNTAVEKTLDLIDTKHNPKIELIKDMSAGAVLVASGSALFIGVLVFYPYVLEWMWRS